MKMKYFLRGLGTGILSATILLFCVYSYKMSDSKIVEKARAMGMEYSKEKESDTEAAKDTKDTEEQTEDTTNQTEDMADSTEESSTEEEDTTLASQESISEARQTDSSSETIEVSISSGMNSENISEALQAAGVIDSAKEFNQYLIDNNMGRYIKSGDYSLRSGMSYEEIAGILQKGY